MKTSVYLMLGSVVNTLEQRSEWLNGGRGAAKGMIDRLLANQMTPFGAAEHLEFWSRRWFGVCAYGFLQGNKREEAYKNGKGSRRGHSSLMKACSVRDENWPPRPVCTKAGPGKRQRTPMWSHASSAGSSEMPEFTSEAATEGGLIHLNFNSCLSPIWRPVLSDNFLFVSRLT